MTQALMLGRKTGWREAGWVPCSGGGRGGFHLVLDEFEGCVGHLGGDVGRKLAYVFGAGKMWVGERAQDRVR